MAEEIKPTEPGTETAEPTGAKTDAEIERDAYKELLDQNKTLIADLTKQVEDLKKEQVKLVNSVGAPKQSDGDLFAIFNKRGKGGK